MKTKTILNLLLCMAAFVACEGKEPSQTEKAAAPVLVSVEPADGSTGVELSLKSIGFTYDQNVKVLTADQSKVSITGGADITKVNAYGKTVTVTVSGLDYGKTYTVTVPAGVVQGFKENQETAAAASMSFTTMPKPDEGTSERESDVAWNLFAKLGLGWNLGNQLDAYNGNMPSETCWGNPVATQQTFNKVKAAGFTTVRIPVTWLGKIGAAPDYMIDAAWMARVTEVVGYAHNAGLNVIVNTHHDEDHNNGHWLNLKDAPGNAALNAQIKEEISAVWTQIANNFKDCGDWLYFEGFNELNDGGWGWSADFKADPTRQCNVLNEWMDVFVKAVRATGGNNSTRWLGIATYAANPGFIQYLTLPEDSAGKLMISVHFYDPSDYTIGDAQYSDWGHTGAAGKKAVGSDEDYVEALFKSLCYKYVNRGIPVYIGEFGCSMRNKADSRAWAFYKYYMEYVVKAAHTYGLPAILWDNGAEGYGKEHHPYIHHGTGDYIGSSKEIVDVIVKAMTNVSSTYTLESLYNSAPTF